MKKFAKYLVTLALAAGAAFAFAQQPQTELPRVRLAAGMYQIDAQVGVEARGLGHVAETLVYLRRMRDG